MLRKPKVQRTPREKWQIVLEGLENLGNRRIWGTENLADRENLGDIHDK
jgi:hypothetical protein